MASGSIFFWQKKVNVNLFPVGQYTAQSIHTMRYGVANTIAPAATIINIMGLFNMPTKLKDSRGTK
jgi:hypothetical protein